MKKKIVKTNHIFQGQILDNLKKIPDNCIQTVITSPPYWNKRDYKMEGQIGHEKTVEEYVFNLVEVFEEIKRVLRDDGTVWLNIGDSRSAGGRKDYDPSLKSKTSGLINRSAGGQRSTPDWAKPKDLLGIPWRVAFALQAAGWYLRSEIIWAKGISFCDKYSGSCMPESCKDRPTYSHEQIFLLTKKPHYFYDQEGIKEDGIWPAGTKAAKGSGKREGNRRGKSYAIYSGKRNPRSVWAIQTKPFKDAHFATFPEKLVEPCIKAGVSQAGCCSKCFSPFERIVNKKRMKRTEFPPDDPRYRPNTYQGAYGEINGKNDAGYTHTETIGWKKTCKCNSEVIPCIVLDPFMGSGTVGVVCKKMNCDYIGIELNPKYVRMAKKRIKEIKLKKDLKNEDKQVK
jgi:DNA modification methylase